MATKTLAMGPVMRERSTLPYRYVLRVKEDADGKALEYVVHTQIIDENSQGQAKGVSYSHGHYFRSYEREKAYQYWADKVKERIDHNVQNNIEF